jgi:hypothetical protein
MINPKGIKIASDTQLTYFVYTADATRGGLQRAITGLNC